MRSLRFTIMAAFLAVAAIAASPPSATGTFSMNRPTACIKDGTVDEEINPYDCADGNCDEDGEKCISTGTAPAFLTTAPDSAAATHLAAKLSSATVDLATLDMGKGLYYALMNPPECITSTGPMPNPWACEDGECDTDQESCIYTGTESTHATPTSSSSASSSAPPSASATLLASPAADSALRLLHR